MKITFILGGFLGFIAHLTFLELSCPLKAEPLKYKSFTMEDYITKNASCIKPIKYKCRKCGKIADFIGLRFHIEGRMKSYCPFCLEIILDKYVGQLDEEKEITLEKQ